MTELQNILGTGFEVLVVVTVKSMVFWVVTPCSLERVRCFRGAYHFNLQGKIISQTAEFLKNKNTILKP
jgi:hypothetical protein